jgi:hypothetical protein
MRTTVDIPDEVYREVKVMAAQQGVTVRELVLDGLERVMRTRQTAGQTASGSSELQVFASAEPGLPEIGHETDDDVIGFP